MFNKYIYGIYKIYLSIVLGKFDKYYLHNNVPMANKISHKNFMNYLVEVGNVEGKKILELGSREVTCYSDTRKKFNKAQYIGFDYYSGENVDIVGDAHKLSQYFEDRFDIIYSRAVFEHFAMPWVVATEIAKCLNVGGLVFVETHFSYASHERPWHFFQFSDMALKSLFSPALGFECLESGMSNPIVGRFSSFADDYLKCTPISGLYCHSGYLGRKIRDVANFDWKDVAIEEVVAGTHYPLQS